MRTLLLAFATVASLSCVVETARAGGVDDVNALANADADTVLSGMHLQTRFVFGTNAKGMAADDVVIRNRADLAKSFDPYQAWTGKTSIGGEWERYQDFSGRNHVFRDDALELTGILDRTQWQAPFETITAQIKGAITPGKPSPIASFGLASTDGIEPGRLVMMQDRGLYRVTAVAPDEALTIEPMTSTVTRAATKAGLVAFPPAYALALKTDAAPQGGRTILSFDAVPKSLAPGAMVGWTNGTAAFLRNDDYRATRIDAAAGTITVPKEMPARKAGEIMLFTPPVTSAQIWSKLGLDLGHKTYAVDFRVVLPGDSKGGFDTYGTRTAEALAKIPSDYPWGGWPALWLYGLNDASTRFHPNSGDEIDVFEGYYDLLRGPHAYSGNAHKGSPNAITYFKADGRWSVLDAAYRRSQTPLSGERRFTVLVTPERAVRFVDGEMVKVDSFGWQNPRPAQIGVNLAIGSFDLSGPMNFLAPMSDDSFKNLKFAVRSIAVYEER